MSGVGDAVGALAGRLRFPNLFFLTAALFVLDVLIPDFIPFVDEILLALFTVMFGMWKSQTDAKPPTKDVTPQSGQRANGTPEQ